MRFRAIFPAVLCLYGLLASSSAAQQRDLIAISELVTDAKDWHGPSYQWLWNDRVFYLRETVSDYEGCLWRLDEPLERLAIGFNRRIQDRCVLYKVSADRKWAIVVDWSADGRPSFRALTLDGSQEKRLPIPEGEPLDYAWLKDSVSFVVLDVSDGRPYLSRYAVESARLLSRTRLPLPEPCDSGATWGLPGRMLGLLPSGRMLFSSVPSERGQAVTLFEIDLDGRQPATMRTVAIEKTAYAAELTLSPAGDRIAWLMQTVDSQGWRRSEVRISKADGSGMSALGGLTGEVDANNPANVRWVPGTTYLSYIHRGKLYAVQPDTQTR